MPRKLKKRKRVVRRKGSDGICIGNLFKPTSYNNSHRHKWMKGSGNTTTSDGHSHKIDIKNMLAKKSKDHTHKLFFKRKKRIKRKK